MSLKERNDNVPRLRSTFWRETRDWRLTMGDSKGVKFNRNSGGEQNANNQNMNDESNEAPRESNNRGRGMRGGRGTRTRMRGGGNIGSRRGNGQGGEGEQNF